MSKSVHHHELNRPAFTTLFTAGCLRSYVTGIGAAILVSVASFGAVAQADCTFSTTPYPVVTPYTVDPSGLAFNGASFIQHGNVMAAGRIDNLILFHVGGEIIPEVTNIVYTHINFEQALAIFPFKDQSLIKINLSGVTTVPHSQLNVPATYTTSAGHVQSFYLICE